MKTYYIGADVHSNNTELAIEYNGQIIGRHALPTAIPAIKDVLASVGGKIHLTFEEGPMAGWLYRNLKDSVEEVVVCDPRRNKLICSDGDADDKIDAGKLAALLRGGYLRAVHHSDDEDRAEFKQWVSLYHDRVRDAVRMINKIRARCRMYGIAIPRKVIRDKLQRPLWLAGIQNKPLANQLDMLWIGYDAVAAQVRRSKRQLCTLSKRYPIIKLWSQLAGIGTIRAVTAFAFLDTPWRFAHKNKLWKYCGIGLQRSASGTDKKGKPKPARLQLAWAVNRLLKNVILGAAHTAIHQNKNTFKSYYERMLHDGIMPSNARHAVARKMLTVMWGMWKTNSRFNETKVETVAMTAGSLRFAQGNN
jgi:transposase